MPEITLNQKTYYVEEKDCEVEGQWVDNGIGPYEYWGARGVDKRIEFEIESITIEKAEDEDGNPVTDKETLKALEEAAMADDDWETWAKLCPNYEPSEPDYEPDDERDFDPKEFEHLYP